MLRGYLRREWPAWSRIYQALGGNNQSFWQQKGTATVRGKLHGFDMELDLGNWSERLTWFLGRYHDLPEQRMIQQLLRPGDCFVDVGANLGMLSLLASAQVGPSGRVLAFEPNPRMVDRVTATVANNRIDNLEVVHTAVSDATGTAELHEYGGHPGWGSLSSVGPEGAASTKTYSVPLRSGDALLEDTDQSQPLVLKIDVEGHEVPVLRSLQGTLTKRAPLVFCEVVDAHQRRAGYSAMEVREQLERHGYSGYVLETVRTGVFGRGVRRTPLQPGDARELDVLFVPPEGELAQRFAELPAV